MRVLCRLLPVVTGLFMLVCASLPAQAQNCTVDATNINFGTVDVLLNGSAEATGTVSIRCTGTAYQIVRVCLNVGYPNASQPGAPARLALGGNETLNFQLYTDPSYRQVWGSWQQGGLGGVEVDVSLGADGTAPSEQRILYGRVFGGQSMTSPERYIASFTGSQTQYSVQYATGIPCAALVSGSKRFPFTVTARVPPKCSVATATMDFGTRTSLSKPIDASTNFGIVCSKGLPYQISVDGGTTGSTNPARRRMTLSSSFVEYGLYRDPGRIMVWGSTMGADTLSSTGSGITQTVPVYGRVHPQDTPPPGVYTDMVVVTVIY
jgi:spore coat protein U-like protein